MADVADQKVRTPEPVTDDEISVAEAALRDASAWGAEHYEPRMYASAQAALAAAAAARASDPVGSRAYLAQAAADAAAARDAALLAYEEDVKGRFEASRSKLVEVRADLAFPDEFARLVANIDVTSAWFAAREYWNARIEAYHTLKGMGDLYDRVCSLRAWLGGARVQVETSIGSARALDAAAWAPEEMKDAEQKYQDALAHMQAGDLTAAVDSMKAAGLVAARIPFLRGHEQKPLNAPSAVSAPPADVGKEARTPNPGPQPPPFGQRIRIAEMSMSPLGSPQGRFLVFSAAVSRFDVVAADGLRDAGIMEKVLAGLGESWEAAVSRSGYFGFIYNNRIEMVKDLGTYPGEGGFLHAPYAAQFRLVGTRFRVNLVVCRLETGNQGSAQAVSVNRLADVHRYFENLTGNRGITLLLAAGVGKESGQASRSPVPGEMVLLRPYPAGAGAADDHGQRLFGSPGLQPLVERSGTGSSTPPVAYVTLGAGR